MRCSLGRGDDAWVCQNAVLDPEGSMSAALSCSKEHGVDATA